MKAKAWIPLATLLAVLAWAGPAPVEADGIIIIDSPIPVQDLAIRYHRVDVEIDDQVAVTQVDQVFANLAEVAVEGTYIFPLPADAAISDFAMYVDGVRWEGEILPGDEAREIYEDIVRRRRDPALLEYVGRGAFRARIFPIPAHGERRIQLTYSQVLTGENGLLRYLYPLDTERFSSLPLEEVTISVEIRSGEPLKAIYSPSHDVAVDRIGTRRAVVTYEAAQVLPDRDFELYYSVSESAFSANLLSFKEAGEQGFFLLLLSPPVQVESHQILARDVVLVLDTSGSMDGEKIHQAKDALRYVLEHLNPSDRFNLVTFSSSVRTYSDTMRPAAEWREALAFVDRLSAAGGTDIHRALLEALAVLPRDDLPYGVREERPQLVIFLTDGLPTEGVEDPDRILEAVARDAGIDVQIFTFGVGDDVNTLLLDALAQNHRGASSYVRPYEDIREEISGFYAKVNLPLLTDIQIAFQGARVEELYPDPPPDLFVGSQIALVGRYDEGGRIAVTLRGRVNGEEQSHRFSDLDLSAKGGHPFIARIWAARKIGYLLDQVRLHGENRELVDQIIALGLRYGLVTPYTSFLVREDLPAPLEIFTDAGQARAAEELMTQIAETPVPASGAPAVEDAELRASLRSSDTTGDANPVVRMAGDKVFILRDGVWVDTIYDASQAPVPIGFSSDAYFQLLEAHPEWGWYLSVGPRVLVVLDGTAYEVVEDGEGSEIPTGPGQDPPSNPPPDTEPLGLWDLVVQFLDWVLGLFGL
ncbi:MAG: VIT domain-containing protein [Anaerolineae bacterium]